MFAVYPYQNVPGRPVLVDQASRFSESTAGQVVQFNAARDDLFFVGDLIGKGSERLLTQDSGAATMGPQRCRKLGFACGPLFGRPLVGGVP